MFTRGQAITFLEKVFGEAKASNNGLNVSVLCPVCSKATGETEKKKLVIRTDDFRSHCWVCNSKKSKSIYLLIKDRSPEYLAEFMAEFGDALTNSHKLTNYNSLLESEEGLEPKEEEKLELPNGFQLLAEWYTKEVKPSYITKAFNYLWERGISEQDIWYFKFGVTNQDLMYSKRVIVPSFDADGELNFFVGRGITKFVKPKYFNPEFHRETTVFNELNIDWTKELVIVEGVFDLAKATQNAVPLLGSSLEEDYLLFKRIIHHGTPVALALDNDAKRKTYKIANVLYEYGISTKIVCIPEKYNDVGQMTKEEFKVALKQAKNMTKKDLLKYRLDMVGK